MEDEDQNIIFTRLLNKRHKLTELRNMIQSRSSQDKAGEKYDLIAGNENRGLYEEPIAGPSYCDTRTRFGVDGHMFEVECLDTKLIYLTWKDVTRYYELLPKEQRMGMDQFPMFRLATLLARQLSSPIATRIKLYAANHPWFRRALIARAGRAYRAADLRFKMWLLRLGRPARAPLLSDADATQVGADIIGEMIIFSLGAAIVTFEFNRQAMNKELKELDILSQWVAVGHQLEELQHEVALQQRELDRLMDTLRAYAPQALPKPQPPPAVPTEPALPPAAPSPATASPPPQSASPVPETPSLPELDSPQSSQPQEPVSAPTSPSSPPTVPQSAKPKPPHC